MSFSLFKQFQPPTGVEHVVVGHFLNEQELTLVLSKSTLFQVYRVRNLDSETFQTSSTSNDDILAPVSSTFMFLK